MNGESALREVDLSDKFQLDSGRILISGTQALLRLALIRRQIDRINGLNTRGFISGYRGSPLGTLDMTLWREKKRLEDAGVIFQPGVNEDLAATAVWGTQQIDFFPEPQVDGVYAMWYGKGPGVDRSADAMRHGNQFGSHQHGGVLVVVGDDHPGKSSTVVNQSDPLLAALNIPVLYPADVQDILDFGQLGWELSRYCGLWVGLKTVNETVEQTQTVTLNAGEFRVALPDRGLDSRSVNVTRSSFDPQGMDITVKRVRLPLVHAFARANVIDKPVFAGRGGLGIVTAGKSYSDVMHALALLGVDSAAALKLGLAVYKVGCIWPLEPEGLEAFAAGRRELLFVEEKSAILEPQAAQIFVNQKARPVLVGKQDESGNSLLPSDVQLEPVVIADIILGRLQLLGADLSPLRARMDALKQAYAQTVQLQNASASGTRIPYFCSGCPHNTSTNLPAGSMAMAGIGCHAMAMLKRSDTLLPVHMGGEGVNWCAAAHFSGTKHMFQNLGDGTYYHSGLMAIRAAVASGANITYKILYNDAVAMTGGQPIDGPISVHEIARQVIAEGVRKVAVVSDDPEKFSGKLPGNVTLHSRDALNAIQEKLRATRGTTVLIYEQTCAAEKRRRRKRGTYPNAAKRLYINDAVCEGCGDCSAQSTCVSIQPKETRLGTKRQIDQSSCNKDYSCVKGFCPSFVTVLGAEPRKSVGVTLDQTLFDALTTPVRVDLGDRSMAVMIAGIGGTGVITVGAVIGMAALLDDLSCSIFDMTGLSQKNGAVYSHLRLAHNPQVPGAQRIGACEADLVMAFDVVAALTGDAAKTYSKGHTRFVGNSAVMPTIDFQFDRDNRIDGARMAANVVARIGSDNAHFIDASRLAVELCGDTIAANMLLVGYACQRGLLPVSLAALRRAIELNGAAVTFNLNAFALGRLVAHSPASAYALLRTPDLTEPEQDLDELIEARVEHLQNYQDRAWAERYVAIVRKIRLAEGAVAAESTALTRAVAINLSKLMSYKDEYEVGRLYADPDFKRKLDEQFEPGYRLRFNLAPPFISRKSPFTGLPTKHEYGGWMMPAFRLLARLKHLRGSKFDIFGYSKDRRMERQLIAEYEAMLGQIEVGLTVAKLQTAVDLAELPSRVRGFGYVKEKSVAEAVVRKTELLASYRA